MAELNAANFITCIQAMTQQDRNKITKQRLIDLILEFDVNVNQNVDQRFAEQDRKIADLCAKFDEIKTDIRQNTGEIGNLRGQIRPLDNVGINPKLAELEADIIMMKKQLNELEQYNRSNNVEIVGLPAPTEDEFNEDIILEALNSLTELTYEITKADIDVSHPIQSRRRDGKRVNICRFVSRKTKYDVIAAKKKTPDFNYRDNNVYVNEHLSPANRSIFAQASQKRRTLAFMDKLSIKH